MILNILKGRIFIFLIIVIFFPVVYGISNNKQSVNHPRIILKENKVQEILSEAKHDPLLQEIIDEIFRMADGELNAPLITYEALISRPHRISKEALSGKYVLDIASLSGSRLLLLNTAYRFSQNRAQKNKYKNRIVAEINALVKLPDWNPGHFLDVGEISLALAITYDWMFDDLSITDLKRIETSLLNKGMLPGIAKHQKKSWLKRKINNHTQVINAGLVIAALALNDIYPQPCEKIMMIAKGVMPKVMKHIYSPEGVYVEGPSYWQYGTTFNIMMIDALQTALKDDWGLTQVTGFESTGTFEMHSISPTYKYFNFADAPEQARITPALYWLGYAFKEPAYGNFMTSWLENIFKARRSENKTAIVTLSGTMSNKPLSRFFPLAAIWYDKSSESKTHVPTKIVLKEKGIAVLRTKWNDETALYLAIKGGKNGVSHSHLDLGSFVLESDGVRWAIDFGRELYNLPGISQYSKKGKRWDYYRINTKSHNTIMINGKNQSVKGTAEIISHEFSDQFSQVQLDLSSAYSDIATSVKRSIAMVKGRHVVITDEIVAKSGARIRWAMVTPAAIKINGNKAILTCDQKKLYAHIVAPQDTHFMAISTKPQTAAEKQNEGTSMLSVTTIAKLIETKIVIILSNDAAENLKQMIPMQLLSEDN